MAAWADTGLFLSASSFGSTYAAISFGGDIFITGVAGALYKSIGGTGSFTLVAPAPAPGVDFAVNSWNISDLLVFGGELYGWSTATTYLFKWNGSNAWTQLAKGDLNGGSSKGLGTVGGFIYCCTWARLYRYNGTGSLSTVADYGSGGLQQRGLAIGADGNVYTGTTSGKLYRFKPSDSTSASVAPTLSSEGPVLPILYDSEIYGPTGLSSRLFKWNGSNAWTQLIGSGTSVVGVLSAVVFNGRLYAGFYGGTGGGRLLSYLVADSAWTVDCTAFSSYIYVMEIFVHNSRVYSLALNVAGTTLRLLVTPIPSQTLTGSKIPAQTNARSGVFLRGEIDFSTASIGGINPLEILYPIIPTPVYSRELHKLDAYAYKAFSKPSGDLLYSTLKIRVHSSYIGEFVRYLRTHRRENIKLSTPGIYPFGNNYTISSVYIVSHTKPILEKTQYWRIDITFLQLSGIF